MSRKISRWVRPSDRPSIVWKFVYTSLLATH